MSASGSWPTEASILKQRLLSEAPCYSAGCSTSRAFTNLDKMPQQSGTNWTVARFVAHQRRLCRSGLCHCELGAVPAFGLSIS
jgi:hypothetical protein